MTQTSIGGSQDSGSGGGISNTCQMWCTRVLVYSGAFSQAQMLQANQWAWAAYNTYGKPIAATTIQRPVIASSAFTAGAALAFTAGQDLGYPVPTDAYNVYKNSTKVLSLVSAATAAAYATTVNGDVVQIGQVATNANGTGTEKLSIPVKVGSKPYTAIVMGQGIQGQPLSALVQGALEDGLSVVSNQWYKTTPSTKNFTGQLAWSTTASPTMDATGVMPSAEVTLSDGTTYATLEIGNVLPANTPGAALSIAQRARTSPTSATRPSGNTGIGYFTRYGEIYDPNGVRFTQRGANGLHYDDGFISGGVLAASLTQANFNAFRWFVPSDDWNTDTNGNFYILESCKTNKIVPIPALPSVNATLTGTIAGTLLTVTAVQSPGVVCPGAKVYNAAVGGTLVGTLAAVNAGTGTGGIGTYTLNAGATAGAAGLTTIATSGNNDPQVLASAVQLWINDKTHWQAYDKYTIVNIANEWGPSGTLGSMIGTISGNVLTVVSNSNFIDQFNTFEGAGATKFTINAYGSGGTTGVGGTGTYQITVSQTVATNTAFNNVTWRDAYITAITNLRAAGYLCCFQIDSGGSGQDIADPINSAAAILAADAQKNVIFSPHIYGYVQSNQAAGWLKQLSDSSIANGLCYVIGEFGPYQASGVSPCSCLGGEIIMACDAYNIGFTAWAVDDHSTTNPPDDGSGFCLFRYWRTDGYSTGDPTKLTYWGQQLISADTYRGTRYTSVLTTVT
jgi:hypothetical protein